MSRNGQKQKNVRAKVVAKNLKRQQSRERTRVAQEVHKLQQLEAGDKNPHLQELRAHLEHLYKAHNNLVEAHNKNAEVYRTALVHADTRIAAVMLMLDDLIVQGPSGVSERTATEGNATQGVDWRAYIKRSLDKMKAEMERQAQQLMPVDPLVTPTPEADEDLVEFGGDVKPNGEDSSFGEARA